MVYSGDLKSPVARHGGSSPPTRTSPTINILSGQSHQKHRYKHLAMQNIFLDLPDFIETDPRKNRAKKVSGYTYNVNAKFQYVRHRTTMPEHLVSGMSVLDLGCCIGATGAWVLSNGATSYTGVEIETPFCEIATENLTKHFANYTWKIVNQSFNEFFKLNTEKFDLVVAFGVMYTALDFNKFVNQLTSVTNQRIIVDSMIPPHILDLKKLNFPCAEIDKLAIAELVTLRMMGTPGVFPGRDVESATASLTYLSAILNENNFLLETDYTNKLTNDFLKNEYVGRWCASFVKSTDCEIPASYEDQYKNDPNQFISKEWKFDKKIADKFVSHAQNHIPGYDKIIGKTVNLCQKMLTLDSTCKIIDVGCATGNTIKQLASAGFHNLVGVDSSVDMLLQARKDGIDKLAHIVKRDTFPVDKGPFRVVICNWTLHFIKDKETYLKDIYDSLQPGGSLILTDKTYNDGIDLELYHDFKRTRGVTEVEIMAKAESVKNVMYIDPPEWYLSTLKSIGFEKISIIDADYCFTSFLATKGG